MSALWSAEFRRLASILGMALILGLLVDAPGFFLGAGLTGYFAWHLYHLRQLERWLQDKSIHPPEAHGIWGEVFHRIYLLQQRNRQRKRRLAGILGRFREATTAMPDGTVVIDANGAIQWFNDAARRLLGLSSQDAGQRIHNLVRHPEFVSYLARGEYGNALQMASPEDPDLTLSIRIVPYGNEQRLLIARDISHLQRLEQMRRDFVANVSHELRTPLTVINGFLETLADGAAGDDPHLAPFGRSLQLMQQQSNRMQQIVEDLLLLSRLETDRSGPRPDRVPVPAMLEMIRDDAEALSGERRHVLRLECDPGLTLLGAERELHSVFGNLVSNAIRYTPEGGAIDVRWYADSAGAHFEVRDTGIGIAAIHLPRLTERFYRVDIGRSRQSGGTGLGLAIVKHVLNRHQARLRIDSVPGKGSTFACDFPPERIVRDDAVSRSAM